MRAVSPFLFALLVGGWLAAAAAAADFEAANQLYDSGKFAEAKRAYEQQVERGPWTANLFYNLGNTCHRLEQAGPAILAYQRALVLQPGHPEATANLSLLRQRSGATAWPATWREAIFPSRWIDAQVVLAAVAGWAALALVMWIALTPPGDKVGRWFALVLTLLAAGYAGAAIWHGEHMRAQAIVVAAAAEIRLAPAASAPASGALPAGSEVRILSVRGDWTYCLLPEQRRGWIASKQLERVRLGES